MTDKELLELAAKAAGFNGDFDENEECMILHYYDENGLLFKDWNPLTDDGDALRLAVKLQISINMNILHVGAGSISLTLAGTFIKEDLIYQDVYAATRRAIVRAAAAIGGTN